MGKPCRDTFDPGKGHSQDHGIWKKGKQGIGVLPLISDLSLNESPVTGNLREVL